MSVEAAQADLAAASHENLIAVNVLLTLATPGGGVEHGDDELLVATPHPFPFLNAAMRSHQRDGGEDLIERARTFFGERGTGFVVFATEGDEQLQAAAGAAGLAEVWRPPAMVCRRRLEDPIPVAASDLTRVEDLVAAREYWALCESAYRSLDFPPGVFEVFPPELLLDPAVEAFVVRDAEGPAAGAMIVSVGGVGMVAWVATEERARGKGLGALVTVAATNAAFDRGDRLASLQASPMGEQIYRRLGYEDVFEYLVYAEDEQ